MNRIIRLILLGITLLILTNCSQYQQKNIPISNIERLGKIMTNYRINDVTFDKSSGNIYLTEEYTDYIWVYSDFDFINKFGGKGNNQASFQRLSDIAISEYGNLLALDNLQRKVRVFDRDGVFRKSIALDKYPNPTKITLANDDLLYLYDKNEQEIIILNLLTGQEFMRFGKFEIGSPQNMNFLANKLFITDSDKTTTVFGSLGGLEESYPNLLIKDNFNNYISVKNDFIFINNEPKIPLLSHNIPQGIALYKNTLVINSLSEVLIFNLNYQK